MGMGEPMHNYDNVWTALRRLTDPDAFGLGARHITLSTVGLVPMIDRMADEGLQIGLAVSLHAPDDELRTSLVPDQQGYRWTMCWPRSSATSTRPVGGSPSSTRSCAASMTARRWRR